MFKATIVNEANLGSPWSRDFSTEAEAQAWIDSQMVFEGRLAEREVLFSGQPEEDILSERIETVDDVEIKYVTLKAQATSSIIDISAAVQKEEIKSAVAKASDFGRSIWQDFSAENILLGISAAPVEVVESVFAATEKIGSALDKGILALALKWMKAIPAEDKDETYLTDARILIYVNKIESYLGLELSVSL